MNRIFILLLYTTISLTGCKHNGPTSAEFLHSRVQKMKGFRYWKKILSARRGENFFSGSGWSFPPTDDSFVLFFPNDSTLKFRVHTLITPIVHAKDTLRYLGDTVINKDTILEYLVSEKWQEKADSLSYTDSLSFSIDLLYFVKEDSISLIQHEKVYSYSKKDGVICHIVEYWMKWISSNNRVSK